jgi:anthranilate synthase component II
VILIIDHFDSFSHNLYQLCSSIHENVAVRRCDDIKLSEIADLKPSAIVLSPGPGTPSDTGVTMSLLRSQDFIKTPMIGVCLGFQAILEAVGAKVEFAPQVVHGKTFGFKKPSHPIYEGQEDVMELARYHSLVVYENTVPECVRKLMVYKKMVMAAEIKGIPRLGFQYHPESFLTKGGVKLMKKTFEYFEVKI